MVIFEICGKLKFNPQVRNKNGSTFTTAYVVAESHKGSCLVAITAGGIIGKQLAQCQADDVVHLAGNGTVNRWTDAKTGEDRYGLSLTVSRFMPTKQRMSAIDIEFLDEDLEKTFDGN